MDHNKNINLLVIGDDQLGNSLFARQIASPIRYNFIQNGVYYFKKSILTENKSILSIKIWVISKGSINSFIKYFLRQMDFLLLIYNVTELVSFKFIEGFSQHNLTFSQHNIFNWNFVALASFT